MGVMGWVRKSRRAEETERAELAWSGAPGAGRGQLARGCKGTAPAGMAGPGEAQEPDRLAQTCSLCSERLLCNFIQTLQHAQLFWLNKEAFSFF